VRRWLIGAALGAGVAGAAYWRRALTLDGALAAAVVGCVVFARGGVPAAGALLAFFTSSSALSRLGERRKQHAPLAQAKGARRDAWQVVANGGVATLCIAMGRPMPFVGAMAAAGADTWATELGLLANGSPRLITTLRRVPAGTSGGITPEGVAASLGGGLIVGTAFRMLGGHRKAVRTAALAGVSASLADSLLGATLQAEYWCPHCQMLTEDAVHRPCDTRTDRRKGYAWMTNETVNVLATVVGAALGGLLGGPNAAGHVRGGS
jgi:uncharacterized protein (TIGR00297 family)